MRLPLGPASNSRVSESLDALEEKNTEAFFISRLIRLRASPTMRAVVLLGPDHRGFENVTREPRAVSLSEFKTSLLGIRHHDRQHFDINSDYLQARERWNRFLRGVCDNLLILRQMKRDKENRRGQADTFCITPVIFFSRENLSSISAECRIRKIQVVADETLMPIPFRAIISNRLSLHNRLGTGSLK